VYPYGLICIINSN